ncbi:hypothetical protein ACFQZ4_26245 [Catellatospora coxensis]|uniref:Uncharacterized protein n=1 Tax=Catellatospora coxensis TaxID=310354 RepID=A0A8J3PAU4_9ACTN|nr:hypothetical protein [Catellatospora coxensis]GIG09949.1 hypothetical protein Cco03nite_66490 [Catellatospora coxensis]
MTQQLFDDVIGEVPAPGVDVDRIIRRERRGAAARRLAGVSTGALALLAAGAVALGSGAWTGGQTVVAVPVTAAPGTADPAPVTGFRLVYGTPEEAAATAQRLAEEFDKAVLAVVPDRVWMADGGVLVRFKAKGETGDIAQTLFSGGGDLSVGQRLGHLHLQVAPIGVGPSRRPVETERRTIDGDLEQVLTTASVQLADGRTLRVYASNLYGDPIPTGPVQSEPPLTADQLQAIAQAVAAKVIA